MIDVHVFIFAIAFKYNGSNDVRILNSFIVIFYRQIDNSRKISLQKAKEESLGFIITGGIDSSHGPQPIFIQTVMPGGVAYKSKLLKLVI